MESNIMIAYLLIHLLGIISGIQLHIIYTKIIKKRHIVCPKCKGLGFYNTNLLESHRHGMSTINTIYHKCEVCKGSQYIHISPLVEKTKEIYNRIKTKAACKLKLTG
jgi:hypothetical protein